jgi:hypothetical protein
MPSATCTSSGIRTTPQSAPDEYIGKWVISGSGRRCATFEWENSEDDYDLGEDNPDVYVRYINRVNRTTGGAIYVQGVDADGSSVDVTSWRNGDGVDPDAYVAEECTVGHNCEIVPNGSLVPESDTASERGMRIQALDSAQHALETYGAIMDTSVELHYPGKAGCDPSCFVSRSEIHVAEAFGDDAFYPAHEFGHAVQMQEFNQDYLRDVCGDSHTLTSSETDSCSTTEGWADYVAVVSWYEPNNKNSKPEAFGFKFEAAAPTRPCARTTAASSCRWRRRSGTSTTPRLRKAMPPRRNPSTTGATMRRATSRRAGVTSPTGRTPTRTITTRATTG